LFYRRVELTQFKSLREYEMALTKRLVVIGTAAANALCSGLLGTVPGIMLTFQTRARSGALAVTTVMVDLSLAIKATVVGLVVAIPYVVLDNVLRRHITELLVQYKTQCGA
jgi:biopolymer transport protein ExbB